jgi:hypothetical protein
LPINKTSWLTVRNPYSDSFRGCCVLTPLVVGLWRPTFSFCFLSSTWSIDKVFCVQLHYKSYLFPHSLEWLLVLRTWIMCNASLSISTMSLTSPTLLVSGIEKEPPLSYGCSNIAYPSLGWGASSLDCSIAYFPPPTSLYSPHHLSQYFKYPSTKLNLYSPSIILF